MADRRGEKCEWKTQNRDEEKREEKRCTKGMRRRTKID